MQYVVNFTSMQYLSTSVDTGTEGVVDYSRLWRQAWVSTTVAGERVKYVTGVTISLRVLINVPCCEFRLVLYTCLQ